MRGGRGESKEKAGGGKGGRIHTLWAELIVCLVSSAPAFMSGGGTEKEDEKVLNC